LTLRHLVVVGRLCRLIWHALGLDLAGNQWRRAVTVGLWLDDQLAVDHVHPAGEAELTRAFRPELDGGLSVSREGPVQRKVRKDHPGRALAAFLAVENDPERNALMNADQVG